MGNWSASYDVVGHSRAASLDAIMDTLNCMTVAGVGGVDLSSEVRSIESFRMTKRAFSQ